MTSTQSSGQILKTDSLARLQTPRRRKEELLDEFDRSGLSGPKFAQLAGLKYSTFAAWVAKRKRSRTTEAPVARSLPETAQVQWLEAVVDQAKAATAKKACVLTVYIGKEARTEIADVQQIQLAAMLLRALEKAAGC